MAARERWDSPWVALLLDSYRRLLGHELPGTDGARPSAAWLYHHADFSLLAHDGDSDPRFVYANLRALRCFEYRWEELIGLPSRLSAPAPDREERAALLADVALRGYSRDYRGLRVAKSGRRFWIEKATVWNIHDAEGRVCGQAAMFATTTSS
jgi:PAS domain S-box-containing protein